MVKVIRRTLFAVLLTDLSPSAVLASGFEKEEIIPLRVKSGVKKNIIQEYPSLAKNHFLLVDEVTLQDSSIDEMHSHIYASLAHKLFEHGLKVVKYLKEANPDVNSLNNLCSKYMDDQFSIKETIKENDSLVLSNVILKNSR